MLTLTIKKKWFDMILSGEKKEEYRDCKPYYQKRFCPYFCWEVVGGKKVRQVFPVRLRNGYDVRSPSIIAKCTVRRGTGKPEWGAEPGKEYYVLDIIEMGSEK